MLNHEVSFHQYADVTQIYYSARKGAEFRIGDGFFFLCRDLVIIDFFGNLRRAVKLVLNSPTRQYSGQRWSVAHTIRK